KKLLIFSLAIMFLCGLSLVSLKNTLTSLESNDSSYPNELKSANNEVAAIHINNNWSDAVDAGICSGSGLYSDPYVIEDKTIDSSAYDVGILIENSDNYFYIEGCTIDGQNAIEIGIKFNNITNGGVFNSSISNLKGDDASNGIDGGISAGVWLLDSSNNTLKNNTINDIKGGQGATVSGYNDGGNGGLGSAIGLSSSSNNTIINNTLKGIYGGDGGGSGAGTGGTGGIAAGFYLNASSDNNLSRNIITGLTPILRGGNGGIVDLDAASDGGTGSGFYFVGGSNNNSVNDNNIEKYIRGGIGKSKGSNGGEYGFFLAPDSLKNDISYENLNIYNDEPIIYLYNKTSEVIADYKLVKADQNFDDYLNPTNLGKIAIVDSSHITIRNNTIDNIDDVQDATGIYVGGSSDIMINNNSITNLTAGQGNSGLYQKDGGKGGRGSGIYAIDSTIKILTNNTISNVQGGKGGKGGYEANGGDGGDGAGISLISSSVNILSKNSIKTIAGGANGAKGKDGVSDGTTGKGYGFNIKGCEFEGASTGIGLSVISSNITTTDIPLLIQDTIIKNYDYGLYLDGISNAKISNNNITDNQFHGFYLKNSEQNNLTANNASLNLNGICLENSHNNTLIGNNASYNDASGIFLNNSFDNEVINNIAFNSLGIYLEGSNENIIHGNNVSANNDYGILLNNSDNNVIAENNAIDNDHGIFLKHSDNNTLKNNNASLNSFNGFFLWKSQINILQNNIASDNPNAGYLMVAANNNSLISNTASDNNEGINVQSSHNNTLIENVVSTDNYFGIFVNSSHNNTIKANEIKDNYYGINLTSSASYNLIFLNNFISNDVNAYDYGTKNQWDNQTIGNYWDDYTGEDTDNDGIGEDPYSISGSAGSEDNFPIWYDGPMITIENPKDNEVFKNAPEFSVQVTHPQLNVTWYSLNGGANITYTSEKFINQTVWESLSDGPVMLTFYANDTFGMENSRTVFIDKDTTPPSITINFPQDGDTFGSTAPSFDLDIIDGPATIVSHWYTLNNGENILCSSGGTVRQDDWDALSDGEVTITFYAEDSVGNVNSKSITVNKDTAEEDDYIAIPGYSLLISVPMAVTTMIGLILIKRKEIEKL
ncbi:MAG: NosD domain-containing protein, partial [Promethearchaeia archaeon]